MFLSGSVAMGYLLVSVIAFLFALLVISLLKMYRREESLSLSSLGSMSFYCKDFGNAKEFFSQALCHSLGQDKIQNLEEFLSSFDKEYHEVLIEILSLTKEKTNHSTPIAFYNKKTQATRHCVYTHSSIVDPVTQKLSKIFIFFHDVTKKMDHMGVIKPETKTFKAKLLYKNEILNVLPFPVWIRDKDLRLKYFNTQFNDFVSQDQQYSSDFSFSRKEDELTKKALESKTTHAAELYVVINGKRQLYHFHEIPFISEDEEYLMGVGYSCEDKDKIKSELNRHIAAQADLLESTASAVAIYGADTKLKFFNHAFVKMWGLEEKWLVTQPSYGDFLNKLRSERKLPEQIDFQKFKNEQLSLFTDLRLTQNEFLYLPNGKSLRVIVIPHTLGGLLFSYEDMTDRLALERSYNILTAVQKSTIDHLNEGVTVFSEDGRLQVSNDQFSKIWNISKEILDTKPHLVVLIKKMIEQVQEMSGNVSFSDEFFVCINSRETKKFQVKHKEGSVIEVLFVPLPDGATLICYRDISDAIMVEQILVDKNIVLQEADKLKTEFLANMSYELRSPLTSIIGFSGLLEEKHFGKLNKKQLEYVNSINDSSRYLMSLINDILDVASIEAGYMILDIEETDLKNIIESMVELVSQRISSKSIKLHVICSQENIIGVCDVKRIKQVIFKMLNNAIGRVQQRKEIVLKVRGTNEYLAFTIKDYGYYVSDDDQKQMFNKFYGVGNAAAAQNKDNLGMSLVKSIIEMHGGRVTFLSHKNQFNMLRAIIPLNNQTLINNKVINSSTSMVN